MEGLNSDAISDPRASPEWVQEFTGTCSRCGRTCYGTQPEGTSIITARCWICGGRISEEGDEEKKNKKEKEDKEDEEDKEEDDDTSAYTDSNSSSDDEEDEQLIQEIKLREKEETILKTMISIVKASIKRREETKRIRNSAIPDGDSCNQSKKRRLR